MQTVILNADYTYLNTVPLKRAITLIVKEKVEILKTADKVIRNYSGKYMFKAPLVMRLLCIVKTIYKNRVPYSKKNVLTRDEFMCQYCGSFNNLTVDHVVPSSRGGKTGFENCVASCKACNVKKANKTPEEANMFLCKKPYEPSIADFLAHKMKNTGAFQLLKKVNIY